MEVNVDIETMGTGLCLERVLVAELAFCVVLGQAFEGKWVPTSEPDAFLSKPKNAPYGPPRTTKKGKQRKW